MHYTVEVYHTNPHKTWGVYKGDDLVCVCVYKKGAINCANLLNELEAKYDK